MPDWIQDGQRLNEFLSYVLAYAPNFPEEDYLESPCGAPLCRAFVRGRRLAHSLLCFLPSLFLERGVPCDRS